MPSSSAPSPKIFVRSVAQVHAFITMVERIQSAASESDRTRTSGSRRMSLIIAVINQDCCPATRTPAGLDVTPAVADDDASGSDRTEEAGSAGRPSVSGSRIRPVVVAADAPLVERTGAPPVRRASPAARPALRAARDVRLVGDYDEGETRSLEPDQGLVNTRQDLEILHPVRRVGPPFPHDRPVDHAVAIEKYRGAGAVTASTPTWWAPS